MLDINFQHKRDSVVQWFYRNGKLLRHTVSFIIVIFAILLFAYIVYNATIEK